MDEKERTESADDGSQDFEPVCPLISPHYETFSELVNRLYAAATAQPLENVPADCAPNATETQQHGHVQGDDHEPVAASEDNLSHQPFGPDNPFKDRLAPEPTGKTDTSNGQRKRALADDDALTLSSSSTKRPNVQTHNPSREKPMCSSDAETTNSSDSTTTASNFTGLYNAPAWYRAMSRDGKRHKQPGGEDLKLQVLKALITKMESCSGVQREARLKELARAVQEARFMTVTKQLVRNHAVLHPKGLPAIFTPGIQPTVDYPAHLKADASQLWTKWSEHRFVSDEDLLHGIQISSTGAASLMKDYWGKKPHNVVGNNCLANGQWWPLQICLVRDGAHGSSQGGIASRADEGVFSVVLAGGRSESGDLYENVDDGETVLYCGTDGKDGCVSDKTMQMLDNHRKGQPIRLIRSSTCIKSKYKPREGFRYDGIYKITGYEVLKPHIQRHRFKLVRESGQDEIRWRGEGARPTQREVDEWKKIQKNRKFIVAP